MCDLRFIIPVFICLILFPAIGVMAQEVPVVISGDTTKLRTTPQSVIVRADKDSLNEIHSPKKAAIRSALIPGWGQAYNKKYWKIPIVYGALGTSAGVFVYNLKTYRELRLAYSGKYNARVLNDSTDYFKMKPRYLPVSEESLRFNRNEFRRNIDYSVLVFVLLWGLNVVDATVDAHLKSFDVSPDLSLKIKPGTSEMANTTGVALVLQIGK
jgi:hypothetical protein